MKYKPLIAGLAMTALGLTGCSASSDSTPPPEQGGTSAPSTEASSAAPSAPTSEASSQPPASSEKSLDEMLLTGKVAGLSFKKAPEDAQNQAGGLGGLVEGLKVKPAKCKKVMLQGAQNAADADAETAVAQKGKAVYSTGVLSGAPSLKTARKNAQECNSFSMDVGIPGAKASGKIATSDLSVDGVTDAYTAVTTLSIAGQKQSTISAVGQAGKTTISVAGAGSATRDTVEEVFAAQAKKVTS